MDIRHGTRFFLGANSPDGFRSLFDDFVNAENGDFLWVIKGGPGCGKSGFMKRLAAQAAGAGRAVEYISCALDHDSLDAVYFPELRVGYVDGTAPHVIETYKTGAASMCLDLGAFYDVPALRALLGELTRLEDEIDAEENRMRSLLRAAGAVNPRGIPGLRNEETIAAARRRVAGVVARELGRSPGKSGRGEIKRRFISAFGQGGEMFLDDTVSALCERVYTLDNDFGLAPLYLEEIKTAALERGHDIILCPDPMSPETPEAILIPELALGFVAISSRRGFSGEAYRHVRLDALQGAEKIRELRPRYRAASRLYNDVLGAAAESMSRVHELHQRLEALYKPHINFAKIDELAKEHCKLLLS